MTGKPALPKAKNNPIDLTELREQMKAQKTKVNLWVEGIYLYFRPDVFPSHEVKEWGGRWQEKKKCWRLPLLKSAARRCATTFDVRPDDQVKNLLSFTSAAGSVKKNLLAVYRKAHKRFKDLYAYQQEAVFYLLETHMHGQMLALSPGLGKTPTSIVAADIMACNKVLVVAPLSLCRNWVREINAWSEYPSVDRMMTGGKIPRKTWVVTNYDALYERGDRGTVKGPRTDILNYEWDLVIFDESVLLKNRKSKRVAICKAIAERATHVWLLSGSPITRDYSDLWAQFNIIQPEYFTAFWRFTEEYCVVEQSEWGWSILGSRQGFEMRAEFPDMMIVRNQDEELPGLPEFIFKEVEIDLTPKQAKAHQDLVDDWVHRIDTGEFEVTVNNVISELIRLQQCTSNLYNLETTGHPWPDESAKADAIMDDLLSGEVEFPVLIWTHWRPGAKAMTDRILKRIRSREPGALEGRAVEHVHGAKKAKENDKIIERFEKGDLDVLVMSLGVGKYGHTLTESKTVMYLDKSWDSDAYFQSLYRVKRIGLKHRPLIISYRAFGTVDEFVEANLAGKMPPMANVTGSDLTRLLSSLGPEFTRRILA